jgi:hypothetical protein
MTDLWEDEGFGTAVGPPDDGEDDWDDDESAGSALDHGFDDPAQVGDDDWDDGD